MGAFVWEFAIVAAKKCESMQTAHGWVFVYVTIFARYNGWINNDNNHHNHNENDKMISTIGKIVMRWTRWWLSYFGSADLLPDRAINEIFVSFSSVSFFISKIKIKECVSFSISFSNVIFKQLLVHFQLNYRKNHLFHFPVQFHHSFLWS